MAYDRQNPSAGGFDLGKDPRREAGAFGSQDEFGTAASRAGGSEDRFGGQEPPPPPGDGGLGEEARSAGSRLKEKGREALDEVKRRASSQVDQGASQAARRTEAVKHALDSAAEQLDGDGEERLSRYARSAASQIDRATRYLRDGDPATMLADLRSHARTHPAAFLGTTFVAGLALGRFLRASEPRAGDGANEPQGGA